MFCQIRHIICHDSGEVFSTVNIMFNSISIVLKFNVSLVFFMRNINMKLIKIVEKEKSKILFLSFVKNIKLQKIKTSDSLYDIFVPAY